MIEDCPVCKSTDTDVDNAEVDGDFKIEYCYCCECDSSWQRKYAFVENAEIFDARL
jgi:hypothetical protein